MPSSRSTRQPSSCLTNLLALVPPHEEEDQGEPQQHRHEPARNRTHFATSVVTVLCGTSLSVTMLSAVKPFDTYGVTQVTPSVLKSVG